MNKKQILELSLLIILLISGACTVFNVPYSKWAVALSGFLLASLYFYLAFWLYAEYSISLVNRIVAGLLFSANIVAWAFCFLNWHGWQPYCIISYIGLGIMVILCLFNRKKPGYKQLLYRGVFFIGILSVVYCYRLFSV
jgi:hypothetical protein